MLSPNTNIFEGKSQMQNTEHFGRQLITRLKRHLAQYNQLLVIATLKTLKLMHSSSNSSKKQVFLSDVKMKFPREEQGIVMPYQDEITIEEYVLGLGKYVNKKDILCAGKMPSNEVNVYFESKEIVDHLVSKYPAVEIRSFIIPIRRLSCRKKRIIIVCSPSIPHKNIEIELLKLRVKLITGISFIQREVGKHPGIQHVPLDYHLRHFYADVGENERIPEIVKVIYGGKSHTLLLKIDEKTIVNSAEIHPYYTSEPIDNDAQDVDQPVQFSKKSYLEKQSLLDISEHTAPATKKLTYSDTSEPTTMSQITQDRIKSIFQKSYPRYDDERHARKHIDNMNEQELANVNFSASKTIPSMISEQMESDSANYSPTKIRKRTNILEEELKKIIECNPNDYSDYLLDFINKAKRCQNIKALATKYTDNPKNLLRMSQSLRGQLKYRVQRNTLDRIIMELEDNSQPTMDEPQPTVISANKKQPPPHIHKMCQADNVNILFQK